MDPRGRIELRLFGQMRVLRAGEEVHLPTRKAEHLLALLALRPGRQSRDRLAGVLWGDSTDAAARASLRNALSILRRHLGSDVIEADRDVVALRTDRVHVDVVRFRRAAEAFLDDPTAEPGGIDLADSGDELLAGCYDDWVLPEREHLRSLRVATLLAMVERLRTAHRYREAADLADRIVRSDPTNEQAHQHAIFCRAAAGDTGSARRAYERCRDDLATHLGVEPGAATRRLLGWLDGVTAPRQQSASTVTNLPVPASSFVGRDAALERVHAELASRRLVTLTGAGGAGKTRLAVESARRLHGRYDDGVWWVDLSQVEHPERVGSTIAHVVGAPDVAGQPAVNTVASLISTWRALLVIDNCEHLLGGVSPVVDHLLRSCPDVDVLATSRERLGVDGERVQRLDGLATPCGARDPHVESVDSVRLLLDRVAAIDPSAPADDDLGSIADICDLVEGQPLALELAATPIARLGGPEALRRLHMSDLDMGHERRTPERHRSLERSIAWSHDLIDEPAQHLLHRLSVFAGGWTLEAAEQVCADEILPAAEIAPMLARLVDASLVDVVHERLGPYYRMLAAVRRFAADRLGEPLRRAVRDRHLSYFCDLAERVDAHLGFFVANAIADAWLPQLDRDHANLRSAIEWSLDGAAGSGSADRGARLAANLHWCWYPRGRTLEGAEWLERLSARSDVDATTRALVAVTLGYLRCWRGDFDRGRPAFDTALDQFRALGDASGEAFALHGLGFVALGAGDQATSAARFRDALARAGDVGDGWMCSFSEHFLAIGLSYGGAGEEATARLESGNRLLAELGGHRQGEAFALFHLARLDRRRGDRTGADRRLRESLRMFEHNGDLRGIGYAMAGLAMVASADQPERAMTLDGAVAAVTDVIGPFLEAPLIAEYDSSLGVARAGLSERQRDATQSAGRRMPIERAVGYALGD